MDVDNSKVKVSVVMPLYNAERTVLAAIESVLNQTHRRFELLVVDDCSVDSGPEIVSKVMELDDRVRLISLPSNVGAGVARNVAISQATGERIAFLDSDDLWFPTKLSKQLDAMAVQDVPLISCWYTVRGVSGSVVGSKKAPEWLTWNRMVRNNSIGCLTAMYDCSRIGKVYMPELRKRQDYSLWLSIIRQYGRSYCLQETLAEYRLSEGSVSSNKLEMLGWNYRMFRETQGFSVGQATRAVLLNGLSKLRGV